MKVAISGHMNLPADAIGTLRDRLHDYLSEAQKKYRNIRGITCLAPGADQLFAEVCFELNIPYKVILPCADYSTIISDDDQRKAYFSALERASYMQRQNYQEGSGMAYWDASQKMIIEADLLIAIWNEEAAKGHGGTADVVKLAQDADKPVIILNPDKKEEIQEESKRSIWDILGTLPFPKMHEDDNESF